MLQEELKKALQEKRRTPPAGFEERSNIQVLRLTSEVKPGRRYPARVVILCAVLLVFGIATTLAATVDVVNARLHAYWPEAAEFLMPVHTSCESEGIRMEVISAVVRDNKVNVLYSMQDLEGDRIDEHTYGMSSTAVEDLDRSNRNITLVSSSEAIMGYDEAEKKVTFAAETEYDQPLTGNFEFPFYITSLEKLDIRKTDLYPLLEQYGNDVKTNVLPANAHAYDNPEIGADKAPESFRILDYTQSLELPMHEHVTLGGIGWIDGALHVQLHYPDHHMEKIDEINEAFPVNAWIQMTLEDGLSPWYTHKEDLPGGAFAWSWDENGDDFPDWEEYVFPCTPAEAENSVLQLQVKIAGKKEVVEGNWFVKIPLRMIQFEEGE
ncbi:MAG: hypothetical protein IKZ98_04630 [Clostridia bacterium]|nr:hypothetical protein [Clostridia bacterium]